MKEKGFFLEPVDPVQRRYEALRACFVEGMTSREAAERFGVSVHTVNVWRRDFRAGRMGPFFREQKKGREGREPHTLRAKEEIVRLRKQNLSITEIAERLAQADIELSLKTIAQMLDEEGFARLPRRTAGERARYLAQASEPAEPTDVKLFAEEARVLTAYAGLFFFIPLICELGMDDIFSHARLYGSRRIPTTNYLLSYLSLKLLGGRRLAEATALSFDRGLGVFSGLNSLPKASSLTTYSYRHSHQALAPMLSALARSLAEQGLARGEVINLDFHPIPAWGEDSEHLEENWIPARGKRMRSVQAFFAQDLETTYLLYSSGDIRADEASGEVLAFVRFFRRSFGRLPGMLIFDSRLTTLKNLAELDRMGVRFLTLRRRGKNILREIEAITEWKTLNLDQAKRIYKRPRVHERKVGVKEVGEVREFVVTGNGREKPMLLITNDPEIEAREALMSYSHRWRIENALSENVDFFNLNALSSAVIVKVDFDIAMTIFANALYKLLASKLRYYEHSKAKTLFRNFVEGRAEISIDSDMVLLRIERRGRNPLLMDLASSYPDIRVPWWGGRRLVFEFV